MQKSSKIVKLHTLLEKEYEKRNCVDEVCFKRPDPLFVAKKYNDETISLICALFAYGSANQIMKFLLSLDFTLLEKDNQTREKKLEKSKYRFQNSKDIIAIFETFSQTYKKVNLEKIFFEGYKKNSNILEGLKELISFLYDINPYRSCGYEFFLGKIPAQKVLSPYKRWNMYLKWMVREDNLDIGLWKSVSKKDLLLPLDTHTFKVGQQLGLLKRKSYDLKAVIEITHALQKFDKNDPTKYDFALYRIGQEKIKLI